LLERNNISNIYLEIFFSDIKTTYVT
jgi:hypothetical protein